MAKLPHPPLKDEDFEAPTLKRAVPAELRDPHAATYVTTKLRKAEIEALLTRERREDARDARDAREHEGSGMRPAVSDEDIERFARREALTLPAPPDPSASREGPLEAGAAKLPTLPEDIADLDADDER